MPTCGRIVKKDCPLTYLHKVTFSTTFITNITADDTSACIATVLLTKTTSTTTSPPTTRIMFPLFPRGLQLELLLPPLLLLLTLLQLILLLLILLILLPGLFCPINIKLPLPVLEDQQRVYLKAIMFSLFRLI